MTAATNNRILRHWPRAVAVALVLAALIAIASSALDRYREIALREPCAFNLATIGNACLIYANDHQGRFPMNFAEILKETDIPPVCFLCPYEHSGAPATFPATWPDTDGDYLYTGAGLTTDAPADVIVAREHASAHRGNGAHLLFADGHVEFIAPDKLPAALSASDALRRKWEAGLPSSRAATP
jgi:prepilin-type processing-associated H-X9-DG protein